MECPIDNTVMTKLNKEGVVIDVCPTCKGVWLDRGELEKIIVMATDDSDTDPDVKHPGYPDIGRSRYAAEHSGYKSPGHFLRGFFDVA